MSVFSIYLSFHEEIDIYTETYKFTLNTQQIANNLRITQEMLFTQKYLRN